METVDTFRVSITSFFNQIAAFFPRLIGALIILLIGWLIARAVRFVVLKLLKAIHFERLTAQVGIDTFLQKGGINKSSSDLLASLLYWIILLIAYQGFFDSLNLVVVSNLIREVILYIPNILVACILIIVGMYLADFVKTIVVAALRNGNIELADVIGSVVKVVIMFLVFSIALSQLRIGQDIITTVVSVVLGAFGLALAIAFGFGAREWAADVVNRYLRKPGNTLVAPTATGPNPTGPASGNPAPSNPPI